MEIKKSKERGIESRQNRRATQRHLIDVAAYHIMVEKDRKNGAKAFTMPGSQKRW